MVKAAADTHRVDVADVGVSEPARVAFKTRRGLRCHGEFITAGNRGDCRQEDTCVLLALLLVRLTNRLSTRNRRANAAIG